MYARQRAFEYRNKPNKSLARLFSEEKGGSTLPGTMTTRDGLKVSENDAKLQTFVDFYQELYKILNPEPERVTKFLDVTNSIGSLHVKG